MYISLTGNSLVIITKDDDGKNLTINANIDTKEVLEEVTSLIKANKNEEVLHMFLPSNYKVETMYNKELFEEIDGSLYMKGIGVSIPEVLAERLAVDMDEGVVNFWKLCAANPDPAARDNLFWFLDKWGYHILPNGHFVAYRKVVETSEVGVYTDQRTKSMKIRFGELVSLDRMLCDSVQDNTCSSGLHVAAEGWLNNNQGFGDTSIVCIINPIHVVAVPPSDGYGKMRVCQYLPICQLEGYNQDHVNDFIEEVDAIALSQIDDLDVATAIDGNKKILFPHTEGITEILKTARESIENRVL
jgi:hypothetical protein